MTGSLFSPALAAALVESPETGGLRDDVAGPLLDLFVDAADVLTEDADADELHATEEQHERDDRRVADREVDTAEFEADVGETGDECQRRRHEAHHGAQVKQRARKRDQAVESDAQRPGEPVVVAVAGMSR